MTVFTELTSEGRTQEPASPENPVYYVAQPDGFRQRGQSVAGEEAPPLAHIDYFVRKALATAGYFSVPSVEVRPSLFILYRWGTHNTMNELFSEEFQRFADAEVLERARLVGGKDLVKEMARQMAWGESILDRNEKLDYLKDQAFNSCYFVVLLAFDYDAMVRGERRLLWRTNMTVNSVGVSLRETLPPLIASAAPFLGRETAEPEITTRTLRDRARVEVGPAILVGYDEGTRSGAKQPLPRRSPDKAQPEGGRN
ncbi:MAG TPA: hypothetical protein VHO24_06180 [Opitutaceae bacterium]|nr:hypothetical protein [Opitutaceae bacterium]